MSLSIRDTPPPPQLEHCPAPFLGLTVQPCSELCDSAAGFDVFPVKVIEIEKKPLSSQSRTLCQSLVPYLHLGGSDFKSAERQQNRNYMKKNLNSKNIANFFCRIKKTCRKNHAASFHAQPCRDEKHVQKTKRNRLYLCVNLKMGTEMYTCLWKKWLEPGANSDPMYQTKTEIDPVLICF
jgi:hypothetical protein